MMLAQERQEAQRHFIEALRARFEEEGFAFQAYPDAAQLPDFMGPYTPDAIALKGDQKVAIEIKTRPTLAADRSLTSIRRIFEGHPDWQFRVVFMGDAQEPAAISDGTPEMLRRRLAETRALLGQGQARAAFVAAWALLEATFRRSDQASGDRLYAPGSVVQALAMDGRITPETERRLRDLVGLRNRIVHGDLVAEPSGDEVETVLSAAEAALSEIEAPAE